MRAVVFHRYGGPENLVVEDVPEPKVAPAEVLIEVRAAGVNPVDWKLAAGGLDGMMETHFPVIPGWDVAGVVTAVGLDSGEFVPGDEVFGYIRKDEVQHGAYAERVSANVRMLAKKPSALGWVEAAGLPLAGLTAYQALRRANVSDGDTVLIHAAAGGVGSLAVQIAIAFGARVIGTASERNHDFVRSLGGEPVRYGEGLEARVRELASDGVRAAFDFVGGGVVELSQRLVSDPARVVSIADPNAAARGSGYLWVRPSGEGLAELAALAQDGKLRVPVDRTFPLEQAAEAWRASQTERTRGKLVLTT